MTVVNMFTHMDSMESSQHLLVKGCREVAVSRNFEIRVSGLYG